MGRLSTTVCTILAALLLQIMFGSAFAVAGVTPNIVMVAVILIAFVRGSTEGTIVGFIAGLALDFLGAVIVGPMALTLTITGFVAGIIREQVFAGGWLLPMTVLGFASLASETVYLLLLIALGTPIGFFSSFFGTVLPSTLYAVVIAVIVFKPVTKFLRGAMTSDPDTVKRAK